MAGDFRGGWTFLIVVDERSGKQVKGLFVVEWEQMMTLSRGCSENKKLRKKVKKIEKKVLTFPLNFDKIDKLARERKRMGLALNLENDTDKK